MAAAWFQVYCPLCTAALQVRLGVGNTTVECALCEKEFVTQVQPAHLPEDAAEGKRPQRKVLESGSSPRPMLTAYNIFMKGETARVRKQLPNCSENGQFRVAAARWHDSLMNPKNLATGAQARTDASSDDVQMGGGGAHAHTAARVEGGAGNGEAVVAGCPAGGEVLDSDEDEDPTAMFRRPMRGPVRRGRPPAPNASVLEEAQSRLQRGMSAAQLTAPQLKQLLLAANKSLGGSKEDLVERYQNTVAHGS